MKPPVLLRPVSLLLLIGSGFAGFGLGYLAFAPAALEEPFVLNERNALIDNLKADNELLRNEVARMHGEKMRLLEALNRSRSDESALQEALAQAEQEQGELYKERTRLSKNLDRLRRPLDENIYSSTVRTVIKPEETLLTGGFEAEDGRRVFSTLKPRWTTHMGERMIIVEGQIFHATPEQLKAAGLETLLTNAGNVMQHGELWQSDALASHLEKHGVEITSIPDVYRPATSTGSIEYGDYKFWTTPYGDASGSGDIDMEVQVEIKRPNVETEP